MNKVIGDYLITHALLRWQMKRDIWCPISPDVLVYGSALTKIFCTFSPFMWYICCHVVAHELDVNELIPMKEYEKTTCAFITSLRGQLWKKLLSVKY